MSDQSSRVFRKAALDRLSDPDQLDEAIRVVRPFDLVAVLALACLVAAGVVWLFLGQVKTLVPGDGIFAPADGAIVQVSAPAEGSLSALLVTTGQAVTAGMPLAQISQPELRLELAQAQAAVAELQARNATREAQIADRARSRDAGLAARRAALDEQIAATTRRVSVQADQLARDEALLARGLVVRRAVEDSRRQLDDARQALLDFKAALVALDGEALAAKQQDDRDRAALAEELRIQQERVTQLDLRAREFQVVLAPADGRVKELLARPGERVAPGVRIATLETGAAPVRLVAYVAPETGKRIAPGMAALVVPSTVRRAETGGLRARVLSVSSAPVSPQAMIAVLGNESLLPRFAPLGAPFEVVIELERDTDTGAPLWATGQGPMLEIDSGTLATAEITVRIDPPIALLMPAIKALLRGGGGS